MFRLFLFCIIAISSLSAQLKVVTSTPNLANIVEEIGKEKVKVESLLKPQEDMHFLDVNPVFMNKMYYADVFIETGLGAEPWVIPLLEGAKNPKILRQSNGHLNASTGVRVLGIPAAITRDLGDIHPQGNPHYLLDPVNSKTVAGNIYKTLVKVSPKNAAFFKKNLITYNKNLRKNLIKWLKKVKPHKGKIKFVSFHQLWPYFTRRFGLVQINTIEPKPGIQPSSKHLEILIEQMKAENCKLIIVANIYPLNQISYIAEKTGAKIIHAPIEAGGNKDVDDYFSVFDNLLDQIIE